MNVSRLLVVAAFAAICAPLACSDSTSAPPVGKVSVHVVDANGGGVSLVAVDLYKVVGSETTLWRGAYTGSTGVAVFGETNGGIVEGDYLLHVTFVTNFHLADGETNDKPVTVHGGDDLVVTFHAVSTVPHL
jgi:5-hydroxyisourate hydrolase-like protein (transthyretin family)